MQQVCHTLYTHNVSDSKHIRGKESGGWMCLPTWNIDFTHTSIRIDYTSPPHSIQATLKVAESKILVYN